LFFDFINLYLFVLFSLKRFVEATSSISGYIRELREIIWILLTIFYNLLIFLKNK
jgi:hypothetical protein